MNNSQIVGGKDGLLSFKNFKNALGTWALSGEGITYDQKTLMKHDKPYPAVIDTGSSQLEVPSEVYQALELYWKKDIPELNCEKGMCVATEIGCDATKEKLKPIGLIMNGHVFELMPDTYLYEDVEKNCYLLVHENKLSGNAKYLYLVGDTFLSHFYSVYDYEGDSVGLGVNVHSEGRAY